MRAAQYCKFNLKQKNAEYDNSAFLAEEFGLESTLAIVNVDQLAQSMSIHQ